MSDPLEALRLPIPSLDPDPAFTTRLRARLERALTLPPGVVMTETSATTRPATAYRHADVGYAWLSVPDLDRALAFYETVLSWTVTAGGDSQGRQVTGRSPHLGLHGGAARGTLHCSYAVEDIEAAIERVRAAGGRAGEPSRAPYGLMAGCTDDQGTVFALYQPPGGVGSEPPATGGHGDLVYTTFEVVDSARARAFYGAVLGWRFTPGGVEDGWQVEGVMAGLQGGHPRATTLPMWRVDDLGAALGQVRAAGGEAGEPQARSYGLEALCADDQGTRFYLGQL